MARKEYVESDDTVTRQTIAQHKVIQTFLSLDDTLVPTTPRDQPVVTQENRITEEAQIVATKRFFPSSLRQHKRKKNYCAHCLQLPATETLRILQYLLAPLFFGSFQSCLFIF